MSRAQRLLLACLISLAVATQARAATLFDPALKFRVLHTPHFRIYFHQGEDRLAWRLASLAETTWQALRRPLAVGTTLPRLTHVVLANQSDLANGYATPLPYNTIVIYTAAPPGSEFATDDWLRLVFTHEFTHIVHLDRSEHWAKAVRGIFGRTPLAFPNLFLPTWQIEGLATYEESAITGEGRLHAGDFRAIVDQAARERTLQPLDRVNGGLTDWPSGQGPYAYGVGFHAYLAERFGAPSLGRLADLTARRVPYTQAAAFKRVFGQSLGSLWRDYEAAVTAQAGSPAIDAAATRLTHQGFVAIGPRFDRFGGGVVFASRTPDGFPMLARVGLDGSPPVPIATRYLGTTTGVARDHLYFDQIEVRRNVTLRGDLYAWSRASGNVRALTRDAGLHDPDVSPDGSTIVAVQERGGSRSLVLVHLDDQRTESLIDEVGTQFDAPRWAPDGRSIAVSRHRQDLDPEIVIVDLEARQVTRTIGWVNARLVMPAWRPDGQAIVAAAAEGDRPFNIFEFPIADVSRPRQLTHFSGGATWPDVSPDGATLVFVGYLASGFDVFAMPYPTGTIAPTIRSGLRPPPPDVERAATQHGYSPLATLRPTSWQPIVETPTDQVRVGAMVSGRDVLGYHGYSAAATWLAASPSEAPKPSAAAPDWFVSYVYDRWRPTLFVAARSETSFFSGPATAQGTPAASTRREREMEGGAVLPVVHTRVVHTAVASAFRAVDDYTLPTGPFARERSGVRGAWSTSTAHTYGYSISPEDGVTAGGTVEVVRRGIGASADATTITADVRAYLRGLAPHHVIATRLAAGRSTGDPNAGRTFLLGGGGPDASVIDFGSGAISLLRGFGGSSFAGSHVAVFNADYRWPLAMPQRGAGTLPLFVHSIHAATFVDVGHTWTRTFAAAALKTSAGAELSCKLVVGFAYPLTLTAGAAWGHDGATARHGATAYLRVGKAF